MLIREFMTPNPVTITPDTSVPDALRLMREKNVRRLPVLDGHGHLVGIVSHIDLVYASPSPATSLSMWEMHDLLAKLKVDKVMTRKVITVTEDTPIEEAARIMADNKIGGLPVLHDGKVVGIITETDLFKAFIELFGGRRPGIRLTAHTSGAKGTASKITNAIFEAGGNIVGLGVNEVADSAHIEWEMTIKVQDVARDQLLAAIRPLVHEIVDVREV